MSLLVIGLYALIGIVVSTYITQMFIRNHVGRILPVDFSDCFAVGIMIIGIPLFWPIVLLGFGVIKIGCLIIKIQRG